MRIDQITPDNVGKLQKIWHYRTGRGGAFKATPIQVGDLLYVCTGGNVIVALDAETGELRWEFDPQVKVPKIGSFAYDCRGVSYYRRARTHTGDCVERIVTATTDARMFAVDAKTGARCASFGGNGEISLLPGMGEVKPGFYFVTSPPTIARGLAIIGGWVMDNSKSTSRPASCARSMRLTGKFVWAWDMGRPGVNTEPARRRVLHARHAERVEPDELRRQARPRLRAHRQRDARLLRRASLRSVGEVRVVGRGARRHERFACAGRSRPCITTSGTTTCRRNRCWSICRSRMAR